MTSTDWCSHCGTLVAGDWWKQFERGEIDWRLEARAASDILEGILHTKPHLGLDLYSAGSERYDTLAEALMDALPHQG